jgi:putative transposase
MIDRAHDLPITRQAEALNISRGSVYYLPRPVSSDDLAIMRRLDRLHLEFPFAGSRMLRGLLAAERCKIGRRHVKTLMRRMGIEALYRRPRTTKPEPGHKIYPYLLRGMEITRPNQVWAMDITYIPMARGYVYLAVVLDWATRRVLSWRLSITMEAAFCVETLEDALARHGKPEIFNTDQGSQFTGGAFTGVLADNGVAISMDGRGRGRCSHSDPRGHQKVNGVACRRPVSRLRPDDGLGTSRGSTVILILPAPGLRPSRSAKASRDYASRAVRSSPESATQPWPWRRPRKVRSISDRAEKVGASAGLGGANSQRVGHGLAVLASDYQSRTCPFVR